jgi:hypothetical protein
MRRFGFGCLGAVAGQVVGWFLVICWAVSTGNFIMTEDEYEAKRASILLTDWLIVGTITILAGLLSAWILGGRFTGLKH